MLRAGGEFIGARLEESGEHLRIRRVNGVAPRKHRGAVPWSGKSHHERLGTQLRVRPQIDGGARDQVFATPWKDLGKAESPRAAVQVEEGRKAPAVAATRAPFDQHDPFREEAGVEKRR